MSRYELAIQLKWQPEHPLGKTSSASINIEGIDATPFLPMMSLQNKTTVEIDNKPLNRYINRLAIQNEILTVCLSASKNTFF